MILALKKYTMCVRRGNVRKIRIETVHCHLYRYLKKHVLNGNHHVTFDTGSSGGSRRYLPLQSTGIATWKRSLLVCFCKFVLFHILRPGCVPSGSFEYPTCDGFVGDTCARNHHHRFSIFISIVVGVLFE